jgi:hypothetical protein
MITAAISIISDSEKINIRLVVVNGLVEPNHEPIVFRDNPIMKMKNTLSDTAMINVLRAPIR